jgi:hypothetical protein
LTILLWKEQNKLHEIYWIKTPVKSLGAKATRKSTPTIDSQAGKKTHGFKSGTIASREIRKYQKHRFINLKIAISKIS